MMNSIFSWMKRKKTDVPDQNGWFTFQWHITDECDQRCKHCYIYGENGSRCPQSMPLEQMKQVVDYCENFCVDMGVRPVFCITGGDPLLHPDFWRLAEMLHAKEHPITILGNPFHLTPAVCRKLRRLGVIRYQLSIDGVEETHDWFRKPGSYKETIEKIGMLKKAGIEAVIMTTVSGRNIGEIPQIVDAVVEAQADLYAFARYCPTAGENGNGITPQQYRELLYTCGRKFHNLIESGCKTHFGKKDHLWALYDYENGRFKFPEHAVPGVIYGGCHCGTKHLTILPNGDVMACRRVPESVLGNILRKPLHQMWSGDMAEYRQLDKFEKCASCELLSWCRGCPAVAKCTHGSFYAPDPQCWKGEDNMTV